MVKPWYHYDPEENKYGTFTEKCAVVQVHFDEVVMLCVLSVQSHFQCHKFQKNYASIQCNKALYKGAILLLLS